MKTVKNIIFVSIALMSISALAMQETSAESGKKLLLAARDGKLDEVRDLIEHGDSSVINYAREDGLTPLLFASQNGHVEIVKLLLQRGANANAQAEGNNNVTALIKAAYFGDTKGRTEGDTEGRTEIVRLLIENGAIVNTQALGLNNATALIMASQENRVEVVKLLLENGADVELADSRGITPLIASSAKEHLDSAERHLDVVKLLLNHGANINAQASGCNNSTALYQAALNGHSAVVKFLIKKGANVNLADNDGFTPLMIASQRDHLPVIKSLLTTISDEDAERLRSLVCKSKQSAEKSSSAMGEIVEPMIETFLAEQMKRACAMMSEENKERKSALECAPLFRIYRQERGLPPDRVKYFGDDSQLFKKRIYACRLLDSKTQKSQDELQALIELNIIQILPDSVFAKQKRDALGAKLFLVARDGDLDAVQDFVGHDKSIINYAGKTGCTPLIVGAQNGHTEIVRLLLESGADVNPQASGFRNLTTALIQASQQGHTEIVRLLLEKGADVDLARADGFTHLILASQNGHTEIVNLLLDAGADINAQAWGVTMSRHLSRHRKMVTQKS